MRLRLSQVLAALSVVAGLVASHPGAASALNFTSCPDQPALGCARLSVPLDRSGAVPGTVSLAIRRQAAGPAQTPDAVIGLAGGPGQAALPLMSDIAHVIAPALATRDLIVFDQRGTGTSNPLSCPALAQNGPADVLARQCAQELGAARGSFTTADSVADLESIRQALGYNRLVLFGVSYGTKVALEYAERYPQHVERLVLDSVVDVNGPDPLQRSTFAAVTRVLSELCGGGACAGITTNPAADIGRLVARMRANRNAVRGRVYGGTGRGVTIGLGRGDLLQILIDGDENPALRALLPAAVQSALHRDPAPLLRLALLAAGLTPDSERAPTELAAFHRDLTDPAGRQATGTGAFDQALNITTTCEELQFPWAPRNASPDQRIVQASSQAAALPTSVVAPFDQLTALLAGPIPLCLQWPVASPAPPAAGPLPAVPSLILSGDSDLRTPTEDARRVAAELPGAQVVVAAHTGHSVLGSDLTNCAEASVYAFFGSASPAPCNPTLNPFRPTPVPPTRLSQLRPLAGVPGRAGRTLAAVQDALVDLRRQIVGASIGLGRSIPDGARFGGLRGGRAVLVHGSLHLLSLVYVPGVTLTGTVPGSALLAGGSAVTRLRVGGSAADHGSLQLSGGKVTGRLGGHRVDVSLAFAAGDGGAPGPVALPVPRLAASG